MEKYAHVQGLSSTNHMWILFQLGKLRKQKFLILSLIIKEQNHALIEK
jgi:hypothetical protein